jgi:hypothetical protein
MSSEVSRLVAFLAKPMGRLCLMCLLLLRLGKCIGYDPGLGGGSGIGIQSSQEPFPTTIVTFFGIDLTILVRASHRAFGWRIPRERQADRISFMMVVWYHYRLAWWAIVLVTLLSASSWFGSCNCVADALSRAHPDWTDFESVHAMRRRLDIAYHYTPEHLDDEYCRYLTEAECQVQDEALADAKVKRNGRHLSPSVGDKIRVLVLLIRFPNHKSRVLPTREYFETMFNGVSKDDEVNPVGSIAEYMRFSSLGAYRVQVRTSLRKSASAKPAAQSLMTRTAFLTRDFFGRAP